MMWNIKQVKITWPAWKIPRNKATRVLAALAAIGIILGLFMVVDFIQGNPVSLWWTEKSLQRFFDEQFPEERYVVAPGSYGFWDGTNRYACPVYQTGKQDTKFLAYRSNGQVYTTKAIETDSGINAYNRVNWKLRDEFLTQDVYAQFRALGMDSATMIFYQDSDKPLFGKDAVFYPEMSDEAVPEGAAVELCALFFNGALPDVDEKGYRQWLIDTLIATYEIAQKENASFDSYGVSTEAMETRGSLRRVPEAEVKALAQAEDDQRGEKQEAILNQYFVADYQQRELLLEKTAVYQKSTLLYGTDPSVAVFAPMQPEKAA